MVRSCREDSQHGSVGAQHAAPAAALRFVLTGTFHGLNRGDSAMQLAAAYALLKRWPQAQIAIHSPNADDDRELYKDFEVIACARRRPMAALRAIASAAFWRVTGGRAPLSSELQSYQNATAVIDLSGDGLTETFGWRCPLSHTVPLLLACLLRTRFCLMAQTIGSFHRFRPWFRWIFSRAAFITARDDETFRYLSDWNLPCSLERTADLAFLLEPGSLDEARRYLRSLEDFDPSCPILGITPSNLYNVRSVEAQHATPANSKERASANTSLAYLESVASACQALARETQAQILVIPHVFGPGEDYDDRRAAAALAELIKPPLKPLTIREALSPPQLKALIGCCDLFVGIRMHSIIAAVSQAIPTLAIAYSPKVGALMERIGMKRYVLDVAHLSASDLTNLARELWRERQTVRGSLTHKLGNDIFPASQRNLDLLDSHISALA